MSMRALPELSSDPTTFQLAARKIILGNFIEPSTDFHPLPESISTVNSLEPENGDNINESSLRRDFSASSSQESFNPSKISRVPCVKRLRFLVIGSMPM